MQEKKDKEDGPEWLSNFGKFKSVLVSFNKIWKEYRQGLGDNRLSLDEEETSLLIVFPSILERISQKSNKK